MDAYNFDTIRHQARERVDHRALEASNERLARELRGPTAASRATQRLWSAVSSWQRPRLAGRTGTYASPRLEP
jgi:hypothetical protein